VPPGNLDAWETCQRGWWHYYRFTRDDLAAAVALFHRALELDSGASLPHSGIAYVRMIEALYLWADNPREAFVEAMTSARAALAADPLDSVAYSTLGFVSAFVGKHDEALAATRKSIELNPSSAIGYHALALTHMVRGEPKQTIRATETAIRISPSDVRLPVWLATLSAGRYLAHDYEKAAEVAHFGVQRAPHYPFGWRSLANALGRLGRIDDAHEALEKFLALMPGYTTEQAARSAVAFRDEAVFQHSLMSAAERLLRPSLEARDRNDPRATRRPRACSLKRERGRRMPRLRVTPRNKQDQTEAEQREGGRFWDGQLRLKLERGDRAARTRTGAEEAIAERQTQTSLKGRDGWRDFRQCVAAEKCRRCRSTHDADRYYAEVLADLTKREVVVK
jgi:Flp pilus assembly protein TadD